jgi:hypothetical protein
MALLDQYITHRSTTHLTVADVFREHWDAYGLKHRVSRQQAKVVGSIMSCRTPALGGLIDQCQECGALVFRYNLVLPRFIQRTFMFSDCPKLEQVQDGLVNYLGYKVLLMLFCDYPGSQSFRLL